MRLNLSTFEVPSGNNLRVVSETQPQPARWDTCITGAWEMHGLTAWWVADELVRGRRIKPGRRMRRVCTMTLVHYGQTVRLR
jgi:hypothetical protein